uniref:Uncharacterized protein n=1 Tax=Timema genevievae TaxID=629358 RepID=A0A7R9K239_TIMGE|nr:unnamed protein product [Timema genevievae]
MSRLTERLCSISIAANNHSSCRRSRGFSPASRENLMPLYTRYVVYGGLKLRGKREGVTTKVSDIRRALEENGGGSRRGGGSKPFNNRPLEDQEPSEGSWRGKGQVKQASPAGTQSSPPRGRGRGVRGGRSMTSVEFVPTSSRTLPVKSVSETRTTPSQIEGDMENYPALMTCMCRCDAPLNYDDDDDDDIITVNSQVIIPTQDSLSRDIGRMSISEPAQTNNREYQNQRRPNMNLLADAVFRHHLMNIASAGVAAPRSVG